MRQLMHRIPGRCIARGRSIIVVVGDVLKERHSNRSAPQADVLPFRRGALELVTFCFGVPVVVWDDDGEAKPCVYPNRSVTCRDKAMRDSIVVVEDHADDGT